MEDFILISDRDKGLLKADGIFPHAIRAWCCFHLSENVKAACGGISARDGFWKVARARTEVGFRSALAELEEVKFCAANYIARIPPELYACSHFPGKRYGHDTSNFVESANAYFWKTANCQFCRC